MSIYEIDLTMQKAIHSEAFTFIGMQCIQVAMLIQDARSVSLYSYNRSQILQNVKYTK